jgi:prepilin-type N-terminal cleavage/methylation domain-containing protein
MDPFSLATLEFGSGDAAQWRADTFVQSLCNAVLLLFRKFTGCALQFEHGNTRRRVAISCRQSGITLIEIMIVLAIVGLLLGGVLKGQELVTSARVRALISTNDAVRKAYLGFVDRYRALPGDYDRATANIANIANGACPGNGNGNGRIEAGGVENESVLVWEHLSKAGFISGSYTCDPIESAATTPTNPFAVRMQIIWDNEFYDAQGQAATPRHNLKSGDQIPSDILAELDRKIDDGSATGGTFRFSAFSSGTDAPAGAGTCYIATAPNPWNSSNAAANCGAATLF